MQTAEKFDVCVLGLGYIGLPTASIFATRGLKVLGVDVRKEVVEIINRGEIHFQEPELDILVKAAVQSGNLVADLAPKPASTFILAVPTPFLKSASGEKIPDLSYVERAVRSLAPVVQEGNLVILESTSPVGTTEKMKEWLASAIAEALSNDKIVKSSSSGREAASSGGVVKSSNRQAHDSSTQPSDNSTIQQDSTTRPLNHSTNPDQILFAHCPERVLPGQMLRELVSNDRITGGLTPEASDAAKKLYQTFCSGEIFLTDARTAEMAKLTENAFRDVNIAFANELSLICDRLEIDVWELIKLANRHPRVSILQPGPGVGGHCIAVDPWFIVYAAPEVAPLIRTAREVNDSKPHHVLNQIVAKADRFKAPVIACFGLAFKANVDDLRESPAVDIVRDLARKKLGPLLVVEPHVSKLPDALEEFDHVKLLSAEQALKEADILVLLVNHRSFLEIERRKLQEKVVIDTRGAWSGAGS